MVQLLERETTGRRARNRLARSEAFLSTAKHIVGTEGLEALTMQRLATDLDCAVGTVYTYFPSKSALVAEVQRDAIERLTASLVRFRADVEAAFADSPPQYAALARVLAFGRFAIAAVDVFPEESRLVQLLTAELRPTLAPDDARRVLPVALAYFEVGREAIEAAAQKRFLEYGEPMRRAVTLTAALNGVLMVSRLSRWDEETLNAPRLARQLLLDLVAGWGGDRYTLVASDQVIDDLEVSP